MKKSFSGCDLACQQEISLALTKTLPESITRLWWIARLTNTRGSCVFNAHEHRVSRDASVHKRNLRPIRGVVVYLTRINTAYYVNGIYMRNN